MQPEEVWRGLKLRIVASTASRAGRRADTGTSRVRGQVGLRRELQDLKFIVYRLGDWELKLAGIGGCIRQKVVSRLVLIDESRWVVTVIGALYKVYVPYNRSLIEALFVTLNSPPVVSFK